MTDYSAMGDEELVALCQENNAQALDALTQRFFGITKAIALGFSVKGAETADLVQEGMLGFLSSVYAYREDRHTSFRTFAGACIRNRIVSHIRTLNSHRSVPQDLLVPLLEQTEVACQSLSPEQTLISERSAEYIRQLIDSSLSDQERRAFLFYLSGMSYEQIASRMEITPKAVDSTLQRSRRKLREKLKNYMPDSLK